jgi:hypothetical protein
MKTFTKSIRTSSICLITAATLSLPGLAHAGWFSETKIAKKVTTTIKAAPNKAVSKINDISSQIKDIADKMHESQPLANALKNSKMIDQLVDVMGFINESQKDYELYIDNYDYQMRADIDNLVGSVTDITTLLGMDSKATDQLHKATNLVKKLPAAFLYPLYKAGIHNKIETIGDGFQQLVDNLGVIADLPLPQKVYLNPENYRAKLCPLVNDRQTKVMLAVLDARIQNNKFALKTVMDLMPEDLTVSVTVVGGGGLTVSKFPPQYIFQAINFVLESIELRLNNFKSIAGAICEN